VCTGAGTRMVGRSESGLPLTCAVGSAAGADGPARRRAGHHQQARVCVGAEPGMHVRARGRLSGADAAQACAWCRARGYIGCPRRAGSRTAGLLHRPACRPGPTWRLPLSRVCTGKIAPPPSPPLWSGTGTATRRGTPLPRPRAWCDVPPPSSSGDDRPRFADMGTSASAATRRGSALPSVLHLASLGMSRLRTCRCLRHTRRTVSPAPHPTPSSVLASRPPRAGRRRAAPGRSLWEGRAPVQPAAGEACAVVSTPARSDAYVRRDCL
jgi:hypothetical protein